MKILFFIENLNSGGKERRLVELLKGLKRHPEIESELVITKKEIHYNEIKKLGIRIHVIERKYLRKDPRLFFLFYRICRKYKPDIIHVWGNMSAFYAIPAKVLLRIPMINSQITNAPDELDKGLISHRLNFKFSDRIIANSHAGLASYRVTAKGMVIHNGFDMKRLKNLAPFTDIKQKFGIQTKYVVGMVATFYWAKDYPTYISAALEILNDRDDVTFLCIGAGDDSEYRKMVPSSLHDKVKFLGKQQNVESIMNICDIGVLATFTEGIPNTIMEFMALEKPVIVTDGGGTSELVIHQESGYLIASRDIEGLVSHIKHLLSDDERRFAIGKAGRDRIQKEFSIESMLESFYQAYIDLLHH
jgi:glycosyltransferase involved in cell wall biosynthesis